MGQGKRHNRLNLVAIRIMIQIQEFLKAFLLTTAILIDIRQPTIQHENPGQKFAVSERFCFNICHQLYHL